MPDEKQKPAEQSDKAQQPAPSTPAQEFAALQAQALALRSAFIAVIDDAITAVTVQLANKHEQHAAQYPDPQAYADELSRQTALEHSRMQKLQGARALID
jgi:hypothetical protein